MDSAPKQPLVTHKQSRKTTSLPTQKQPSKLFSHVTNGFISPHSPCSLINSQGNRLVAHSDIAPETAFTGGEWIRQPQQSLVTHKQSGKTKSLPTQKEPSKLFSHVPNGFVSPHSPC
jgi:hypothetical protein